MPLKRCSVDGKPGWKYGDSGHCYTGPNGRQKAIEQMKAIKVSQSKGADLMEKASEIIAENKKENA